MVKLVNGSFHRDVFEEEVRLYNRYVSCYKEVLELFLGCKTTEDFFKASYKYMLCNLLRNNLVANYLGLISEYNFRVEWKDGLGLANYYSLNLNNDIALSDLNGMIENSLYSDNDKEWTTANEQAKLALEEK